MKKFICIFMLIYLGIIGCKTEKATMDIQNEAELSVQPGEYWQGKMKVLFFSVKKTPQLAAWIEDSNGNYITTVTVTNRGAKKNWRSSPKEGRPEALPVWNHKNADNIDAVSSASSKEKVEARIAGDLLIGGKEYNVYLEINHSFDYNDFWTEDNSGVNGQPSVLYHAKFTMGQPDQIDLVVIGHGSVDGSDGKISSDIKSITTALGIIKNAHLTIK